MAENRKRQQPSSPASRKAQRRETESIWAALHARHCVYCHEWVSDTLFARCAEAIRSRGDGGAIIDTLPASMRDRVRAARWSTRCRGPPHSAYFPERVDKFSYSHSRWKIECSRCDKRWIADNRIVGDMPPDNWRCMEGDPRPSIAGDDGCAVPGHAFGAEGLRERYARFPWDLTIFWDEGSLRPRSPRSSRPPGARRTTSSTARRRTYAPSISKPNRGSSAANASRSTGGTASARGCWPPRRAGSRRRPTPTRPRAPRPLACSAPSSKPL